MSSTKLTIKPIIAEIIVALHVVFHDYDKIAAWLTTPNLNFGGCRPDELIAKGRGKKVLGFIENDYDTGDILRDHKFPKDISSKRAGLEYIKMKTSDTAVIEAFKEAWDEFKS